MKHLGHLFFFSIALCISMQLNAVTYCAPSAWGYGASATGGGSATPTLVKDASGLKSAISKGNKVVIITQNITVSSQISSSASNITIMAVNGAKLISTQQNSSNSGIFYLKGSNIILRNLTFEGPGAYDCDGNDNLCLDGATKVWVDHCDFQDGCDGNFDIKGKTDNITVTWCRFRYLKKPKAGGSGGADDHRFTNLVGSDSSDKPSDGTYNITYGYCWWDEGCKQRMTRCRNASQHFLNCYWNSSVADYYVGPENADCYFEGCIFEGKPAKNKIFYENYGGKNGAKFINCTSKNGVPADITKRSVLTPTYSYTALTAAEAKTAITNSTCGAGATLTVTDKGAISSSCDGNTDNPGNNDNTGNDNTGNDNTGNEDTPTTPVEGDCCINLGLGEEPTVANKGIPADFAQVVVTAELAKGTWDNGYLNMGGNADIITFDFSAYNSTIIAVTFDVTIPNWTSEKNTIAYHWNSNENSYATINSKNKQDITLAAPANAKSFTIQRSASTGTRISQICFDLKSAATNPTSLDNTEMESNAIKIIRNGQIFILRDGKTYNLFGHCVE